MSTANIAEVSSDAGTLPLTEDWFSNFNQLARTSSSSPDQPARRPVLSPAQTRAITSLPATWTQQLLDVFVSVHRNSEKGLSLVSKGLKALPDQLGALKSLETIFLNGNQLETFPDSIGDLTHLSMLFAHNNLLKSLPSTISSLEHLRFLDLHNNQLEELPHNFGESLKRLTELILFKNSLTSLPTSIVGMKHIVKMELQYNALKELPESIGELATLQVLNLSHNVLQSMPSTLGTLRSLSQLDISHNQLVSLPMSMANLKRLQSLWVDSNQLSTVPEVILSLDNLNLLSLRSNFIGPSLPVALSKLCKLTYIWLNDNQIELLPAEIACMQNLQDLYLSSNPCFKAIPAPPTAPINPNPIPVPSSRVYLPSLCAFASRTILEEAAKNAPPDLLPRSSLVPFIKTDYDLSYDILSHVDTIEDACTKCMLPCWGSGKDHIYDEEWYPGQFIRIGWRHCYFCCSRSEQNNPQY